jgi:putative two-component system response regulator
MKQPIHGSFDNHSAQIEQLTRELATRASRLPQYREQLPGEQVEDLCRAAQHRDIGMAQIALDILASASELDADSRKKVGKHTELGAMAVASIRSALGPELTRSDPDTARFLAVLEDVARSHHECWDGSGYPEGKRGDAISLEARIVAIIDSWDSLTSERPWRSAMAQDQALEVIRSGAGSRFDPTLAGLFVAIIEAQQPD